MTGRERGFLLLASHLGDPTRCPLTGPQLRTLAQRVRDMEVDDPDRDLTAKDLTALGYSQKMAQRIVDLLSEEERLDHYLSRGRRAGCVPVTRVSEQYPVLLRQRLGLDAPALLWCRGDLDLLNAPGVALVGSRDLREKNARFAAAAGREAARQGLALISGNARGADRTAQDAALEAGGSVISVVADELERYPLRDRVLWISEDGFSEAFSAQRALSRNRVIHTMAWRTFVAQTKARMGGTWDGTVKNLRFGWSEVYCFDDGSQGADLLCRMGAFPVQCGHLQDFAALPAKDRGFLESE